MKPLRHGDRILLDSDVDAVLGWVVYVRRGRARGFFAACESFYGLQELWDGLKSGDVHGWRARGAVCGYYCGFEQLLAEGLVDPEKSNRKAEQALEDKLADMIQEEAHEFLGIDPPPAEDETSVTTVSTSNVRMDDSDDVVVCLQCLVGVSGGTAVLSLRG